MICSLAHGHAQALAFGRAQSIAVLGRPLDVRIPVTFAPNEPTDSICAKVEVFYGDIRAPATIELGRSTRAASTDWILRVRSSVALDEPVVTVAVAAGCDSVQTRRYTLFTEPPPDEASNAVASVGSLPSFPTVTAPAQAGASGRAAERFVVATAATAAAALAVSPVAATDTSSAAPAANSTKQIPAERRAQRKNAARQMEQGAASAVDSTVEIGLDRSSASDVKKTSPKLASQANRRDRLKIEPIDLRESLDTGPLRSSALLESAPSANPQQRAAFSALWQALSSPPEDIARNNLRLDKLQADVAALQLAAGAQTSLLQAAQNQTESTNQTRKLIGLGLGVAALAAFAAGVWGVLLVRRRREGSKTPWWRGHSEHDDSGLAPLKGKTGAKRSTWQDADLVNDEVFGSDLAGRASALKSRGNQSNETNATVGHSAQTERGRYLDESRKRVDEILSERDAVSSRSSSLQDFDSPRDFALSMPGGPEKYLSADELIDITQQADFFVSLGQHDQAILLLQEHIEGESEASPLPYVDLLGLHHSQDQRAAFESLSVRFQSKFNSKVPSFDDFGHDKGGLEDYPTAMSRITALWPSIKVLPVIEESLRRRPDVKSKPFSLQAYRELIFLYTFVKFQAESNEAVVAPSLGDFQPTRIRPLDSVSSHSTSSTKLRNPDSMFGQGVGGGDSSNFGPDVASGSGNLPSIDDHLVHREDFEGSVRTGAWEADLPPQSQNLGVDIDLSDAFNAPSAVLDPSSGLAASQPVAAPSPDTFSSDSGLIEFDFEPEIVQPTSVKPIDLSGKSVR